MRELRNRVAVVTGAASGIGLALAERFGREGMRVVLADVERDALEEATAGLRAAGVDALAVPTDVSRGAEVAALAERTLAAFGAVHVVCNNAGVAVSGRLWEHDERDWRWVLGVNLWGVIHGIRTFVPVLLRQGVSGHVVNTASMAGLVSVPGMGIYNASKHAVVTVSETLALELAAAGAPVHVSVLCPSFVRTRILDSDRNRPAGPGGAAAPPSDERGGALHAFARAAIAAATPPEEVAALVLEAIRAERFWVLPHPEVKARLRARVEDVCAERGPTPAAPADFPVGRDRAR